MNMPVAASGLGLIVETDHAPCSMYCAMCDLNPRLCQ